MVDWGNFEEEQTFDQLFENPTPENKSSSKLQPDYVRHQESKKWIFFTKNNSEKVVIIRYLTRL